MNILIYIILAALVGGGVEGKIENGISGRLQSSFGKKAQVKVEVDRGHRSPLSRSINSINIELADFKVQGAPSQGMAFRLDKKTMGGRIDRISIKARRFEIEGLAIKEMQVTIEQLKYNFWKAVAKHQLEVLRVDKCGGEIVFEEKALNKFIAPRVKELEEFHLKLSHGEVIITGKAKTRLHISVPVELTCKLVPHMGMIFLTEPRLKATVVPLPSFVAQRVVDQVNPVINLNRDSQLPCQLKITQLKVEPALLTARADLLFRAPAKPKPRPKTAAQR
jgi:hypothetical protein